MRGSPNTTLKQKKKQQQNKPTTVDTCRGVHLLAYNGECLMWEWTVLLTGLLCLGLVDHHSQWCWKLQSIFGSKQSCFWHPPSEAGLHIPVHFPITWTPTKREGREKTTMKRFYFKKHILLHTKLSECYIQGLFKRNQHKIQRKVRKGVQRTCYVIQLHTMVLAHHWIHTSKRKQLAAGIFELAC